MSGGVFEEAKAPNTGRLSNGGQRVGGVVSENGLQRPGHDLRVSRKVTGRRQTDRQGHYK